MTSVVKSKNQNDIQKLNNLKQHKATEVVVLRSPVQYHRSHHLLDHDATG